MRYKRLGLEDRVQIQVLSKRGCSDAEIARELGVHRSSVGRERRRNTVKGKYYYHLAQKQTERRHKTKRRGSSKMTSPVIAFVEEKLLLGWSPQQISGWLKHRQTVLPTISHERIYQHVWQNKLDGGKLYIHLRHRGRRYRYYRGLNLAPNNRRYGPIPNRVDIRERPAIVEQKSRIGDWELDTIVGHKRKSVLVSMVERKSKFLRLALVIKPNSKTVAQAIEHSLAQNNEKVLTLTMDNGGEFARHREFGATLNAGTYFATPYHAWERGLNEHTNGLVRQYFPKATDFTAITAHDVSKVECLLNNRPRAVLGFMTPLEVFSDPPSFRQVAFIT